VGPLTDINALRTLQHRPGREPHSHRAAAQYLLDVAGVGLALDDRRRDPPGQEFRIALDIRCHIKYLGTGKGQQGTDLLDQHGCRAIACMQ
jgi:hypothetical protein